MRHLGQGRRQLEGLYYLHQSYEIDYLDPQTVYGHAFAYMELGDIEQAQKHFKMVLVMDIGVDLGAEWGMAERLGWEVP